MQDLLNFICCSAFVIFKLRFSMVRNNVFTCEEANLRITSDNQKDKEKSIIITIFFNVSNFNRVHNHEASVKNDGIISKTHIETKNKYLDKTGILLHYTRRRPGWGED